METSRPFPEIVPVNREFQTASGDWKVAMPEKPREFAHQTCLRYVFHFSRPITSGFVEERTIFVLVPKDEVWDEHRDEEIRHMIRSRLNYSTELESVLNPYGCPLE